MHTLIYTWVYVDGGWEEAEYGVCVFLYLHNNNTAQRYLNVDSIMRFYVYCLLNFILFFFLSSVLSMVQLLFLLFLFDSLTAKI